MMTCPSSSANSVTATGQTLAGVSQTNTGYAGPARPAALFGRSKSSGTPAPGEAEAASGPLRRSTSRDRAASPSTQDHRTIDASCRSGGSRKTANPAGPSQALPSIPGKPRTGSASIILNNGTRHDITARRGLRRPALPGNERLSFRLRFKGSKGRRVVSQTEALVTTTTLVRGTTYTANRNPTDTAAGGNSR